MRISNRNIVIVVAVIIVLIALTFPLWRPFFINDVVDEAFPTLTQEQRDAIREMPQDERDVLVAMSDDNPDMAADTAMSMMKDDTNVADEMPEMDEPVVLAQGTFNQFDAVHRGEGTAAIYQLPDGSRVLRLEDFRVTNGPELHVILTRAVPSNIIDGESSEEHVDLGLLKGNVGNQNYDIPADVDLDEFQAVVIYCAPFHVNFSVAAFS